MIDSIESKILEDLVNQVLQIKCYDDFDTYFKVFFGSNSLKGAKLRIFRRMAKDFYDLSKENIVVTSIKYSDLKPLFRSNSVSYMGKYGTFNKVKVLCILWVK